MKAFWAYTAARLGLFAASWLVIIGIYQAVSDNDELPILWPLVLAGVLSMGLSLVLLRGLRERAAEHVQGRASRISERFDDFKAKEDVEDDAPGGNGAV